MVSKKICMIGAFCVGKTALVERYVHSIFSDKYLSTLGVKISKKNLVVDSTEVNLVLWDLEGKDDYSGVNFSYLRGAMGFFVVADGTRSETLEAALSLRTKALEFVNDVPNILLVNKVDLISEWEVTQCDLEDIRGRGIQVNTTSAKTGQGVEESFEALTRIMLKGKGQR